MGKIAVIGIGAALLFGFLFACAVIGFALLSGAQEDVGYGTWDDVGADDISYDDGYDSDPTWITGEITGLVIEEYGNISFPTSFLNKKELIP